MDSCYKNPTDSWVHLEPAVWATCYFPYGLEIQTQIFVRLTDGYEHNSIPPPPYSFIVLPKPQLMPKD